MYGCMSSVGTPSHNYLLPWFPQHTIHRGGHLLVPCSAANEPTMGRQERARTHTHTHTHILSLSLSLYVCYWQTEEVAITISLRILGPSRRRTNLSGSNPSPSTPYPSVHMWQLAVQNLQSIKCRALYKGENISKGEKDLPTTRPPSLAYDTIRYRPPTVGDRRRNAVSRFALIVWLPAGSRCACSGTATLRYHPGTLVPRRRVCRGRS
ncbi:uncharacterized protein LY79DRAFT_552466 [Colletotrichum navitas]|uniref:Uncharacterized protein n=1 Tax=Colletotrichum navitas TaxID=681940 RepID=A0AAD8Q124_9PEZI|nr:uncharacterized protein LY79DRAFT_552466 [Colletotrichum navitas]KAK1593321.1 hypothetical protein LY79DRAFT_552466 [Colletotrichum navitas]